MGVFLQTQKSEFLTRLIFPRSFIPKEFLIIFNNYFVVLFFLMDLAINSKAMDSILRFANGTSDLYRDVGNTKGMQGQF